MFASERAGNPEDSFGYHGVFLMPRAIGVNTFWKMYRELDDTSTLRHDFFAILKDVGRGEHSLSRIGRMLFDRLKQIA